MLRLGLGFVTAFIMLGLVGLWLTPSAAQQTGSEDRGPEPHRSPIDLAISPDEQWLLTANHTAGTVSLVQLDGKPHVVAECQVGTAPRSVTFAADGKWALVTTTEGGELVKLRVEAGRLKVLDKLQLGFKPWDVTLSPDEKLAYVALESAAEVAVVEVSKLELLEKIAVERWPRTLALSLDGKRLAVSTSGDRSVSVIDTHTRKMVFSDRFSALNLGQMQPSADGQYVYVPWMVYRQNPISISNIERGWVLASRIARIRLDEEARREAISLDPPGKAVSDPHGLVLTSDEEWMIASAGGTHELLVYRLPGLPFEDFGGPGDHIDRNLLRDESRFWRIPVGGRPTNLAISRDNRRVFVANYLLDAIQIVDFQEKQIVQTIPLGGPEQPSLVRQGEAIFLDGRRSHDQWYSCHSCHFEGGTNAITMDTHNDGSIRTFKTVLSLRNVTKTRPWTWHGWQQDLSHAMRKSLTDTMRGKEPNDQDVQALLAYLGTLKPSPSPYREADGGLSAAAQRGKKIFHSAKAACSQCHKGPYFTDGNIHEVGTGSGSDYYTGYNTPSLLEVHHKVKYLHDGHVKTLEELLTGPHNPANVAGQGELSAQELADLIAYLKSL